MIIPILMNTSGGVDGTMPVSLVAGFILMGIGIFFFLLAGISMALESYFEIDWSESLMDISLIPLCLGGIVMLIGILVDFIKVHL
jgi:hypothetical protein